MRIDLNCDMGEGFGAYTLGDDAKLVRLISSANIACGFHAGEPRVMRRTVALCREHKVAIGAHPGLPDLVGFGRRTMAIAPSEVYDDLLYQLGALEAFCRTEGVAMSHVKPHGGLYTLATGSADLAQAVARAVKAFDPRLAVFALPGSHLAKAAADAGLPVVAEGYADRAYGPDGGLLNRRVQGAVITDPAAAAAQARRMVVEGKVRTVTGEDLPVRVQTLCVHGDNPAAEAILTRLRAELEATGALIGPAAQPPPAAPRGGE